MIVVLLIIAILMSAGLYGLRAMESDLKATYAMRKSEMLARAAEAGAAQRLKHIAEAKDDAGAALASADDVNDSRYVAPTRWPPPGTFTLGLVGTTHPMDNITQYQVQSKPIVTVDTRPPAGVQIGGGGQSTLWEVTSYAVYTDENTTLPAGEYVVKVGVRLWSRGGRGYEN